MFGWSLSDAAHPRRTGVANLRYNLLIRPTESADDATTSALWNNSTEAELGVSVVGAVTKLDGSHSCGCQTSQCSGDSCFDSEFPSLSSTGSSEPESNVRAVSRSGPSNGASSGRMAPIHSDSEHSLASGSTEDCWRGSYHHALAVVEHRGEEMPSLFDQLHELHNDLSSINDQVTQSLQQCRSRRRPASESGRSSCLVRRRRCFGSCQDVHGFTEDQMAFILHRLLTRICELFLARQEGIQVVPLIV